MYKGEIDFLWMAEDLGTQIAPLISLKTYKKVVKPFRLKIFRHKLHKLQYSPRVVST
jgi:hypothetical protein